MPATDRTASAEHRLAALFPDGGGPAQPHRPWYRRVGIIATAAVVVLVAVALIATQAFGGSGDTYRTATATSERVDAVQSGVATIEPVAQATVAFPVSGTVATVNVQVGDHVDATGTLASLDTTALARTLHQKQATLAQAQLSLSKGLAGQSISLGSGSGTGNSTGSTGGGTGASAAPAAFRTGTPAPIVLTAASPLSQLGPDQQAVLTAQQQVDATLAAAATALATENQACTAFATPAPTTPTTTTAPATTPGPSAPPDVTACQQAITGVSAAQTAVSDAQKALATAANDLDSLLATISASVGTPSPASNGTGATAGGSPSGSGATGSGSGGSGASGNGATGGTRTGGTSGSSATGPSAADLVAAQRDVDAAAIAVLAAQQSMDQATIASPLAGTVVAVNMKVGDTVSAASSTEDVVVQGSGGYEVSTLVGVDEIPSITVGQTATVLPDGRHDALTGKVVAISVAPTSSSSSATTYRVVVGLTRPDTPLHNGATGTVAIVTKDAKAALAVPTSAIVTVRNRHFVNVVRGGSETLTPVQVGVIGATWTEITSGIQRGTEVALADASAPLPSSATSSANGTQTTTPFGRLFGGVGAGGAGAGGAGGFTRGGRSG